MAGHFVCFTIHTSHLALIQLESQGLFYPNRSIIYTIATHPRSFDRGAQIEIPEHVEKLTEYKHHASQHCNTDRLTQAVPQSHELLALAAERGEPLGRISSGLLNPLDRYGVTESQAAVQEALQRGVPHPNAVRLALGRRREALELPPPVAITLPGHVQQRDTIIQPHDLNTYDQITEASHDE